MKIIDYTDAPSHYFDSEIAKGVTGRVLIGKNDQADHFCMRAFTIAPGGFSPRHAHPWEHEIFVHSGKGQILKTVSGRRYPAALRFLCLAMRNTSS